MLHYNFYESKNQSKQLLVMLHGFISDATTYHSHIEPLVEHTNVLTIDLPGHGLDTSSMDDVWDFPFITRQLDEVLIQYQTYDVFLLGYSMGGRVALYYAIHGNETLSGLLLESTSAGIQDETDKEERAQVDAARAKVLEIAGLDIFVNDWEKLPLFRSQYNLAPEIRQSIRNNRMNQDAHRLAKA
nr:alpha/beta fold hydrolase [Staphylococcus epidermidis]